MQLSEQTLMKLCGVIVGQPYRTRNELGRFFDLLGFESNGISSRIPFTEAQLLTINGTNGMENVLLKSLDPRNFFGTEIDISQVVNEINEYLRYDGYIVILDETNSPQIHSAGFSDKPIKNIIFASIGPKPEIVLVDALSNDIEIVKNGEYCLVYEKPILANNGLSWTDLVSWWSEMQVSDNDTDFERTLYKRLRQSLPEDSPPSKTLFKAYYSQKKTLGDHLPALIPEVYLHYDPKTVKELAGQRRLLRQRMDFLLLLPKSRRIVIEVDGKQHYSDNDIPSPQKYTEMVSEDRRLTLAGYEVYRFSGYELQQENSEQKVEKFFMELFKKHDLQP